MVRMVSKVSISQGPNPLPKSDKEPGQVSMGRQQNSGQINSINVPRQQKPLFTMFPKSQVKPSFYINIKLSTILIVCKRNLPLFHVSTWQKIQFQVELTGGAISQYIYNMQISHPPKFLYIQPTSLELQAITISIQNSTYLKQFTNINLCLHVFLILPIYVAASGNILVSVLLSVSDYPEQKNSKSRGSFYFSFFNPSNLFTYLLCWWD